MDADFPRISEIEHAASVAFRDVGMPEIADDEPFSVAELRAFVVRGHAWVATDAEDRPVAYLVAELVDGGLHIEQVSVHPDVARRRIGRQLLEHAAGYARARGMRALTLTTFRDVPWNEPYYERCGFEVVPEREWTDGLRRIREQEAAHGLDRW
ncbi:MAG TPA: GNAT family N-acetyltransferase, partial [Rugosimonospora sp.]|nr:GNAT family N-acetyltransferase [Rugosimonospora sp.]